MGLPKKFKWPEQNQVFDPVCNRTFPNVQSFRSHEKSAKHQQKLAESAPSSLPLEDGSGSSSPLSEFAGRPMPADGSPAASSLRQRKIENDLMSTELKHRDLLRQLGDERKNYPDVSEIAGAGPLTSNLKEQLQARMFGTTQPEAKEPKKGVFEQIVELLSGPSAPLVLGAVKGALGIQDQGGGIEQILKLTGLNLADILKGIGGGQVLPQELVIGGVTIPAGTPVAVLPYLTQSSKGDAMVELGNKWLKELSPILAEKACQMQEARTGGHGSGSNGGGGITSPEEESVTCDLCGASTPVPQGIRPGEKLNCINSECSRVFVAEGDIKPGRKRNVSLVSPPDQAPESEIPTELSCQGCGQLLAIPEGQGIGDCLVCPVCSAENIIYSKSVPVAPAELSKEG